MNDTPETDSNEFDGFDGQGGMVVSADFARKLERERDEARREITEALLLAEHPDISTLNQLAQEMTYRGQRILELERELAEARAEVARLREAIRAVLAEEWLLDPQCLEDQALVDRLKEEAAK